MSAKRIWAVIIAVVLLAGLVFLAVHEINAGTKADEISAQEAESFVNDALDKLAIATPVKLIAERNQITVNDISYGEEKDIILDCSVKTVDIHSAVNSHYDSFLGANVKKQNGTMFKSALDFKLEFEEKLADLVKNAEVKTEDCVITLYDTEKGIKVYCTDDVINCVYGGVKTIEEEISDKDTYIDANGNEQEIKSGNVNKGLLNCFELRYDTAKPDTSNWLGRTWNGLKRDFVKNFIEYDRWKTIFAGLWVTIKLTFFALIIGIIIGFVVAFVRCTYIKNTKRGILLKLFNAIFQVYLTVIRGTPAMVQIMIIYFVIFMPLGVDKFVAAAKTAMAHNWGPWLA